MLCSENPLETACRDKLLPELINLVERHMYCNFSEHGFITQLIITFNGGCFHFCHYCTLRFNSPGSEEAEQKLRQRGRQIHTASSSNSFCLVIWLQLRDCVLMKQWQEKWKIHVPLNSITFVNAAVCLCMLFLMDCAFVCHLKWAESFSFHFTGGEFGKIKWICCVLFREEWVASCVAAIFLLLFGYICWKISSVATVEPTWGKIEVVLVETRGVQVVNVKDMRYHDKWCYNKSLT